VRRWRPRRRPAREGPLTVSTHEPSGDPPSGGRRQGFWRRLFGPFFAAVVAVLIAVVVLGGGLFIRYAFYTSPDQAAEKHAPRITDTAFERAAVAICQQYVQVFNTDTTLGDQPTEQQSGDFLETIASTFDAMVAKLKTIPVAPADQAAVSRWLAQWDEYDAFGHQYAAAVSKGDERNLVSENAASQGTLRRQRNAFAAANHMRSCDFT
jgi:hypothetical protein